MSADKDADIPQDDLERAWKELEGMRNAAKFQRERAERLETQLQTARRDALEDVRLIAKEFLRTERSEDVGRDEAWETAMRQMLDEIDILDRRALASRPIHQTKDAESSEVSDKSALAGEKL